MIQQLADDAMAGDAETVRRLLASLMLASDYTNEGWTALHPAVANGRVETARMLLRAGSNSHLSLLDWSCRRFGGNRSD